MWEDGKALQAPPLYPCNEAPSTVQCSLQVSVKAMFGIALSTEDYRGWCHNQWPLRFGQSVPCKIADGIEEVISSLLF